ncbi:hypothetical protein ANCCEY_07293 [Ancylostoma ceylanicum]|uniref:Uncharacterized protein n=1 Tax=Ancylostoma ceylanicum TaxID=53326 RepID=A0A0D6M146_9BILA|nr:hypothetical protein ANCCEY_07293 [Ancylostoma ceylanicum]
MMLFVLQTSKNLSRPYYNAAPGFDAFNKRAFDSFAGQGFDAFNKRAFDSLRKLISIYEASAVQVKKNSSVTTAPSFWKNERPIL